MEIRNFRGSSQLARVLEKMKRVKRCIPWFLNRSVSDGSNYNNELLQCSKTVLARTGVWSAVWELMCGHNDSSMAVEVLAVPMMLHSKLGMYCLGSKKQEWCQGAGWIWNSFLFHSSFYSLCVLIQTSLNIGNKIVNKPLCSQRLYILPSRRKAYRIMLSRMETQWEEEELQCIFNWGDQERNSLFIFKNTWGSLRE